MYLVNIVSLLFAFCLVSSFLFLVVTPNLAFRYLLLDYRKHIETILRIYGVVC